jgi:LemA protein
MSAGTAALVALALLGAALLYGYNRLVRLRNRAQAAWHDIDVYLRRRHDLIPNLVETVKAYAEHERAVLEQVTALRTRAVATEQGGQADEVASAEARLERAVERLFAVAEAYPDLKADARFRDLQHELAATENKIAFSRQLYNDTVTAYRTATQTFPLALVARPFRFEPPPLFAAEGAERGAVGVDLDGS